MTSEGADTGTGGPVVVERRDAAVEAAQGPVELPAELVQRLEALSEPGGERRLLGLTGPPGAGKSTIAAAVQTLLGDRVAILPMDGFHLAQSRLEALGIADRKGAPETFDVGGFVALLRRVRAGLEPVVHAPLFRREIEDAIAGALAIPNDVLVLVEGNYLLLADDDWAWVRPQLDECWYVEVDEETRRHRLLERHQQFGRDPDLARAFAHGSDEANALLVMQTRIRADLVLRLV